MKNFSTFNNIPNIETGRNNKLKIKVLGEKEYKVFSLPTGAYELFIIGEQILAWIELALKNQKCCFLL